MSIKRSEKPEECPYCEHTLAYKGKTRRVPANVLVYAQIEGSYRAIGWICKWCWQITLYKEFKHVNHILHDEVLH